MTEAPAREPLSGLVGAAANGDETAWTRLVERFAPLLWAVCRGYRLTGADLDDVVQAVWLRALEHLSTLQTPEALPGWLATTTRRECLRHLQRAGTRAVRENALIDEATPDRTVDGPDDAVLRAERRDALRAAFALLGERCRVLLTVLMRQPPPAYSDVGAELGMPIGSIGPIRARCLERLRRDPAVAALLVPDTRRSEPSDA